MDGEVPDNPQHYTDPIGHEEQSVSTSVTPEAQGGSDVWDVLTSNYTPYNAFETQLVTSHNAFATEPVAHC